MRAKLALATLGALGASLALSVPAMAVSFGTSTDPIYGSDSGSHFGKFYGTFTNHNYETARTTVHQYDLQPNDGNAIRMETDYSYMKICYSYQTAASWCFHKSVQAATSSTASWVERTTDDYLDSEGSAARGGINLCEIQSWSNDPCSREIYPDFTY